MKLQSAYFSESNMYGSWQRVGYVGPGDKKTTSSSETTNFHYDGGALADSSLANADVIGWQATNVVKLNECTASSVNWTVTTKAKTGDADSYVASTNCAELTPTFTKIGK